MGQPDPEQYASAVRRLEQIVAKIDGVEKRARGGADNGLWRKLHFLRLEVRKLHAEMQAWQVPVEGAPDPEGDAASE